MQCVGAHLWGRPYPPYLSRCDIKSRASCGQSPQGVTPTVATGGSVGITLYGARIFRRGVLSGGYTELRPAAASGSLRGVHLHQLC